MAITVSLQGNSEAEGNPYIADVGKANSNATVIESGFVSGLVTYQIRRKDRTPINGVSGDAVLGIDSKTEANETVIQASSRSLIIVLPFRTDFQVRVQHANNGWSGWTDFRTRDKTYAIPGSVSERITSQVDTDEGARIRVQNTGKCTLSNTSRGATVTNSNKGGNEILETRTASNGWYIRSKTTTKQTSTGAIVTKLSH